MAKKRWLAPVAVLLCLTLAATLGRKPLYYLYRELSFGLCDRSSAEHAVKEYANQNHIPYGAYPPELIELYERNPETRDFVLHYPDRDRPAVDLSSYSRDTVPLFLQYDPMWGYDRYGSSCIAITGCGPTCLAMAGYYLTGDPSFTPDQVAFFAQANGYYAPGYGSSWTLISQGAKQLDLAVKELPLDENVMKKALRENCPVILALGPGDFTTSGHYIVLTGIEEDAFRVNDPNSLENSNMLWTYDQLKGQIRNIWKISVDM